MGGAPVSGEAATPISREDTTPISGEGGAAAATNVV
jgi:hypothetical protein